MNSCGHIYNKENVQPASNPVEIFQRGDFYFDENDILSDLSLLSSSIKDSGQTPQVGPSEMLNTNPTKLSSSSDYFRSDDDQMLLELFNREIDKASGKFKASPLPLSHSSTHPPSSPPETRNSGSISFTKPSSVPASSPIKLKRTNSLSIPPSGKTNSSTNSINPASSPTPWSESPDFHKTETFLSLLQEIPQNIVSASKSVKPASNMQTPSSSPVAKRTRASTPSPRNISIGGLGMPTSRQSGPPQLQLATRSALRRTRGQIRQAQQQRREMATVVSNPEEITSSRKHKGKVGKSGVPLIFLTPEQKAILKMAVEGGESIFFTGAAGTGKSVLLRRLITDLRAKYSRDPASVAVTASTGLAACNVGGITLHSFAGIGIGREEVDVLIKKVKRNRKAKHRWKQTKVLIIDEVSMIDGELFDKLEELARVIRGRPREPFGGIQIVITGDFFQLPPVPERGKQAKFTFESESWNTVISNTIELKEVFRQKDNRFSSMLNELRRGKVCNETAKTFRDLRRSPEVPEGITPTELFPLRREVDASNRTRIKSLDGKIYTYTSTDFQESQDPTSNLLDYLMCVPELQIKQGAQVMMIKNIDETLVNGSLGRVLGFMSESTFKMIEDPSALPTRDLEALMARDAEMEEQGYNSSRVGLEDDPFGIPLDEAEVQADPLGINWKRKRDRVRKLALTAGTKGQIWPYVRFHLGDGTTRDVLVQPETWNIENSEGKIIASRTQLPLILAWALSIHKSQGQTLEWVKVDLSKVFEKGQAYVALSRAVRMEGLQVLGFSESKVMVHSKVVDFYDSLSSVTEEEDVQEHHEKSDIRRFARAF